MDPVSPDLKLFKAWLEVGTGFVVIIGVIVAIVSAVIAVRQYILAVRKEQLDRDRTQRDREYGTYNALDEKFVEFQQLCLKNPDLDIFDVPDSAPASLTLEQKKELIAFTMLFAIFERAFLMYHDQPSEIRKAQWEGWDAYIKSFCKRKNFRDAWMKSGSTFDTRFEAYIIAALGVAPTVAPSPVAPLAPPAKVP